jgi:two-component system cell cycle sensor histidine kinase/response regulator CckA
VDVAEPVAQQRPRILVVDDEYVVRRFAARILADAGYSVATAEDGAEALEVLRGKEAAVDAVVSDIVMPRLNGVQLLEALAVSHPAIPVILMSGYAPTQLAERGIAAPCSVLSKPFAPESLLAEVQRCLDKASPESPAPGVA